MSALVFTDGRVRQLDKPQTGKDRFTPEQAADGAALARKVQDLEDRLARIERQWNTTRRDVTFVDVVTTGSLGSPQTLRFPHGLGGRVWPTLLSMTAGGNDFRLEYSAALSTNDTLVMTSYSTGTFSLRVEEMG